MSKVNPLALAADTLDSVIVATTGTLITVFLCASLASPLPSTSFRAKLLFLLLIGTMLIPPEAGLVRRFS